MDGHRPGVCLSNQTEKASSTGTGQQMHIFGWNISVLHSILLIQHTIVKITTCYAVLNISN